MRIRASLTSCMLMVATPSAAQVVETPSEQDIPRPVPAETSLAGSERPDITRFLNVRSAGSPSLSPDGRLVAFSEAITFHAWSPAGDWILYGSDRGGNEREGFYLISPGGTEEREVEYLTMAAVTRRPGAGR